MNLNLFLVALAALLGSKCVIEARSSDIAESSSHRDLQLQRIDGANKSEIKLFDLCEDVLFIIFEDLDLESVINIVEANSKFTPIGISRFQRMYGKVTILNGYTDYQKFTKSLSFLNPRRKSTLNMFDSELILKLLKYLAPAIHEVRFTPGKNDRNQSDMIIQYINKYGSNYITKLDLDCVDDRTFEKFTLPFERVENLFIKMDQKTRKFEVPVKPLNELFPNVRSLHLILQSDKADYSFLDCELPHFTELKLSMDVSNTTDIHERLLRKNPQVLSIDSSFSSKDFGKFIHQNMPNIESLTLNKFDAGNETFHFDHVKFFKIDWLLSDSIERITFPRLESLNIIYGPRDFYNWLTFFNKHQNLTKLHMENSFENIPLVELTAGLQNLSDVHFGCKDITAEEVAQFIQNHPKLRRLVYWISCFFKEYENTLRNQFENEWKITRLGRGLLFEKKN